MDFIKKESEKRFNPDEEYLGKDKKVNNINPLVSVTVATYQHAPFIKDCLDGILMQKTDFPFEIIIGEDESSDGTRDICKKYAERYPDKIRLFLRDRNKSILTDDEGRQLARFNVRWSRRSARGKYIAICEGDDYWTDPEKLQKQVFFLENNSSYMLTVGGYKTKDINTGRQKINTIKGKDNDPDKPEGFTFTLEDYRLNWITKTLTAVFRNEEFSINYYDKYRYPRDVHLMYHLLKNGKGFYFTDIFGVYRLHDGGVFSSLSLYQKKMANYRVKKEIFDVNRDEISRKMYMASVKSLLRLPQYRLADKEVSTSKIQLLFEGLRAAKSFKEHLSVIKTALIRK